MSLSANIRPSGGLWTADLIEYVASFGKDVPGLTGHDFRLKDTLKQELNQAFSAMRNVYDVQFKLKNNAAESDEGRRDAAVRGLLLPLFDVLGWGNLMPPATTPSYEGKTYPVTHQNGATPFILAGPEQGLEAPYGGHKQSPHTIIQSLVNRPDYPGHWGVVSDGNTIRLLRDNHKITRLQFLEFDLQAILEDQDFEGFTVLYLFLHQSRFQLPSIEETWLDKWLEIGTNTGIAALLELQTSVKKAISTLSKGFLLHPGPPGTTGNDDLKTKVKNGSFTAQSYYKNLLRLVYRFIFLFVTEDKGVLLEPGASKDAVTNFRRYYSTERLRKLSQTTKGSSHHYDMWESVKLVFQGLREEGQHKQYLALPPLNGPLWREKFIGPLAKATIGNQHLLAAIKDLTTTTDDLGAEHVINFKNFGSEELGGVYQKLLEIEPEFHQVTGELAPRLILEKDEGGERRKSGSHYTSQDLIDKVLDHALDPVVEERIKDKGRDEQIQAILSLKVVDPTCGSGHFLVAAARRLGKRLAQIKTGEDEPSTEDIQDSVREIIANCIYGVDLNELAVEICKVGLWLEAMEPGKPLTYLEHHIKCGNALLGSNLELLEKGVPEQAYTFRDGIDDKKACNALKAASKSVVITNDKLLGNFREEWLKEQAHLSKTLAEIEAMPDGTIGQIHAKDAAYEQKYKGSDAYKQLKLALDAWCTAFTYPKKTVPEHPVNITNGHLVDFLRPERVGDENYVPLDPGLVELVKAQAKDTNNAFFHWELEFPQVFAQGGFDVVVGNPPYKGGQLISGEWGHHYNHFLKALHDNYSSKVDIACGFMLKFWQVTSPDGRIGVITTNTIGKGETRKHGLLRISEMAGFNPIVAAYPNQEWMGDANVIVALVCLTRSQIKGDRALNGRSVSFVSTRLDSMPDQELQPLASRQDQCFMGDIPVGKGFVISQSSAASMVAADTMNEEVIFPYLNANDLFKDPEQAPGRYIICFADLSEAEAARYALPYAHICEYVRPVRTGTKPDGKGGVTFLTNDAQFRERWWQFGRYRQEMRVACEQVDKVFVRPGASDTPLFWRQPKDILASNSLFVFADESWEAGAILNSGVHESWFRKQGSGMKQDSRYTPGSCFEMFPQPRHPAPSLAPLGRGFQDQISTVTSHRKLGITAIWNFVNQDKKSKKTCQNGGCEDLQCEDHAFDAPDIQKIRELRDELTVEVGIAYGLPDDFDYGFGFYKDHAGRNRYTMSPEAQENVYLHLVKLNLEQAEAEKQAREITARDKTQSKPKVKKAATKERPTGEGSAKLQV